MSQNKYFNHSYLVFGKSQSLKKLKIKLSRGYKKHYKILAKIEVLEVDVYVRKNVPPVFRNHKSQSYEIRNLSSI